MTKHFQEGDLTLVTPESARRYVEAKNRNKKKSADKASIAVAIIAKNAEKTIGACLDSIVPYVRSVIVSIDKDTTDGTAKVVKAHGAKATLGLTVSSPHECPSHGKITAQHFAAARQESFNRLPKDVDWYMWIDADDVVQGGEKLPAFISNLGPEIAGAWLAYHYSQAGQGGPTSTLFDRERIVRSSMPWKWEYRVHEILMPVGATTESLNWVRTDDISIVHQGSGHDTAGSARRNITLLEIDLEENPNDMRALFYMGNQYFALQMWEEAAYWYERSTPATNPYQLWQSLIYLSMAYEKLGDLEKARMAAFKAIDIQPIHPEPYFRLEALYMMMNDLGRTEYYYNEGHKKPDPPFFVFKNPMDRSFNSHLVMAQAYANNGHTSKAKRALELAAKTLPTKEVMDGIVFHQKLEEDTIMAESWVRVLQSQNGNIYSKSSIPDSVWRFGRVRDVLVPRIITNRPSTQPRIIFWCGHPLEPWAPPSINTTGIGGSETAVIQIAKRFAADGWKVDVYNDCDFYEGEYDGVGYWDLRRFTTDETCDVFVSWRNPQVYELPVRAALRILWCHDLNRGPDVLEAMSRWPLVLGVSEWHSKYLEAVYGIQRCSFVPNGIELDRFMEPVRKVPFRCVYGSSPDRGLPNLLRMWPVILANEPTAELHVAYGWENIDKTIALGYPGMAQFKAEVEELIEKTPRVVWRGRLSQKDLAKLYQESYCMLYPTSFTEVYCISAVEAMAGGCVPVTSAVGALPETIGDAGMVVTGNTYSLAWKDFFLMCAKATLQAPDVRTPLVNKGLERVKGMSWDASYENHWKPKVVGVLEGKREEAVASVV